MLTVPALPSATDLDGTFISHDPSPVFTHLASHPMHKFFSGDLDTKKMQLLHSNKVEGIIFVCNHKVSTMYLANLAYDDPEEKIPVVAGALGSLCHNSFPVAIPLSQVLSETLVYVQKTLPVSSSLPVGKALSEIFFQTDDNPRRPFAPLTQDDPSHLVRLPLCLPKLRGHPIIEGSIYDDTVISSLHNYHTDAGEWIDIQVALAQKTISTCDKTTISTIDASYLPDFASSIPFSTDYQITLQPLFDGGDDPTSLRSQVQSRIDRTKQDNRDRFYLEHPDLSPPTFSVGRKSKPNNLPLPEGTSDVSPSQTSSTKSDTFIIDGVSVHKKYERALNTYRVALSSVNESTVTFPTLRKSFLLSYSQASSQENSRYATAAMKEHDLERAEHTRDYLQRLVTGLHWNHATTSLFLHAMFHTSPLDEQKEILKTSISFLTFLAPPPEKTSPELKEYLETSYVEHMQAVVGESNEKKQKLSIKTFQGGMQNSPHDVLVGLANLESRLSFIVDYSTSNQPKPLFVEWILQLAHIFSSPEFTNFHKKYESTHKWIAHAMVTQIQMVFAMITKVATSLKVLHTIQHDRPLSVDAFSLPIKAFANLISDLHSIISGVGAGVYSTPPLSYVPRPLPTNSSPRTPLPSGQPHRSHHAPQANSNTQNPSYRGSPIDKGWLLTKQRLIWPKNLSGKQLCARFALVGSSCPHGYSCPYEHKFFPRDFSLDDQKIICKFISDHHPQVAFAPGVRIPSFFTPSKSNFPNTTPGDPELSPRPRPRPPAFKRPYSPRPDPPGSTGASPSPKKKVSIAPSN